jgi:hypothetical protein
MTWRHTIFQRRDSPSIFIRTDNGGELSCVQILPAPQGMSFVHDCIDTPPDIWADVTRFVLRSGLVFPHGIARAHEHTGFLPFSGDAALESRYFVFVEKDRLLLLHHDIPHVLRAPGKGPFNGLFEPLIQRMGRALTIDPSNRISRTQWRVPVHMAEERVQLDLRMLIGSGLTTKAGLIRLAGKWRLESNPDA